MFLSTGVSFERSWRRRNYLDNKGNESRRQPCWYSTCARQWCGVSSHRTSIPARKKVTTRLYWQTCDTILASVNVRIVCITEAGRGRGNVTVWLNRRGDAVHAYQMFEYLVIPAVSVVYEWMLTPILRQCVVDHTAVPFRSFTWSSLWWYADWSTRCQPGCWLSNQCDSGWDPVHCRAAEEVRPIPTSPAISLIQTFFLQNRHSLLPY